MITDFGLMAYCWKHKLLEGEMNTTHGESVEVVDAGLHNRNSGPDFFNAKVRMGRNLYVGNVVILWSTAEWYALSRHENRNFDSVILVVTTISDANIVNSAGQTIPVLVTSVPEYIRKNYQVLLSDDGKSYCRNYIDENLSGLTKHSWMAAVETGWMESRYESIRHKAERTNWSATLSAELVKVLYENPKLSQKLMKDIIKTDSIETLRTIVKAYLATMNTPCSPKKVERSIINVVIPFLFAYGRHTSDESLCDRAFDLIEETKPDNSAEEIKWKESGVTCNNGCESAGLKFLVSEYCSKKRCLQCRFGHEFLKRTKVAETNLNKSVSPKEPMQLSLAFP